MLIGRESLTNFLAFMHQQGPANHTCGCAKGNIATGMRLWRRWWLFIVSATLLIASLTSITTTIASSAVSSIRLRILKGALAGLTVDVDPAVRRCVPFGDPRRRDLGRTVGGLLLLVRPLGIALSLRLALMGEFVDEVTQEGHGRAVSRQMDWSWRSDTVSSQNLAWKDRRPVGKKYK